MIRPLTFLLIAAAWCAIAFGLIYREVRRLVREQEADSRAMDEMEERIAGRS